MNRVDRENRIIRGVKVLGIRSLNSTRAIGIEGDGGYEYSLQAMRDAIPLYEGVAVNVDHLETLKGKDGKRRAVGSHRFADRFGRLVNVRVNDRGMFADLEYLASHPLAEMVVEAADRMPHLLALSHHAYGKPEQIGKRVVVSKILKVESVDLIGEKPGTTNGLFE